jgi:hypothetical protein
MEMQTRETSLPKHGHADMTSELAERRHTLRRPSQQGTQLNLTLDSQMRELWTVLPIQISGATLRTQGDYGLYKDASVRQVAKP